MTDNQLPAFETTWSLSNCVEVGRLLNMFVGTQFLHVKER